MKRVERTLEEEMAVGFEAETAIADGWPILSRSALQRPARLRAGHANWRILRGPLETQYPNIVWSLFGLLARRSGMDGG